MMNDCLKYTISPTAQYACLYSISSELDQKIGFDCVNVAPERVNENKKRIENG